MSRVALLFALLLTGCSLAGPSDADIEAARSPEADGVIVNRTSADFTALAVTQSVAAVINIASEVEVTNQDGIIRRGEAAPLAIGGFDAGREDFIVYLFRVRGTRATLEGSVPVDVDDFEREDAVVTVTRF